ncbi:MAG: ACP phosphodiesterase [Pseudazoarcus pumilus]|nr:ACP phosphodiesterase [Pseudazoarcus pumilus]
MNFLAHAWLAGEAPADRLGGLMGDFVKGPLPGGLPPDVAEGVRLHRAIDSFADTHPAFRSACARVPAGRRRAAGILVDMFFDHFLARHWQHFSSQPLPRFTAEVYGLMRAHHPLLPPRLQRILPWMIEDDWLASYAEVDAVAWALDRMSQRLSRPGLLAGAGSVLREEYPALESDFLAFLPAARDFAEQHRVARINPA